MIHFAGLKAVGESVEKPLLYYDNNVHGTLQLLAAMRRAKLKTLVFSSSATVYGDPASVPIREDFPHSATNPYDKPKAKQPLMPTTLRAYLSPYTRWLLNLRAQDHPIPKESQQFVHQDRAAFERIGAGQEAQ